MAFLVAHALLYLNYFVQKGDVSTRLQSRPAVTGLMAITLLSVLVSTSLEIIRRWSYRIFFFFHLIIGLIILPILFFHEKPLVIYTLEALAIFVADRILRQMATVVEPATITRIPHTDLLKVQVSIPESKLTRFHGKSAQHVFVGFPSDQKFGDANRLLSNPFTIADVSQGELTLVLRAGRGPTTQTLWSHADKYMSKVMVSLEGPYSLKESIVAHALEHDRILLVAGGIGATFMIPIFRALREHIEPQDNGVERLSLTWALRSAAEGEWATDLAEGIFQPGSPIHIHLTRQNQIYSQEQVSDTAPLAENMEMEDLDQSSETMMIGGIKGTLGRPNIRSIVDNTFRNGTRESVAVFFCGPQEMSCDLRAALEPWVQKGRSVYWHQENFGW